MRFVYMGFIWWKIPPPLINCFVGVIHKVWDIVRIVHSRALYLSIVTHPNQTITIFDWQFSDLHYIKIVKLYHQKLFKDLRVELYSSVIHHWNHLLKPYSFPHRKIGLIRVTYDPPVSIRVNKYYSDLYSSVIHHWNRQLKP